MAVIVRFLIGLLLVIMCLMVEIEALSFLYSKSKESCVERSIKRYK